MSEEKTIYHNCGSEDVRVNYCSPDDEPWTIRTDYDCNNCKAYWYEED
ncbi:hypothetical protein [Vallitalea okinawensis]|nr:hypothetical protein [Vallitalea okinawensis]